MPALDATLGISHEHDPLRDYLREMRDYMPPGHRAFITAVEEGSSVREFVLLRRATHPSMRDAYNACVDELQKFRATHLDYARAYIHEQSQRQAANPSKVGTGGTPFMAYLKRHLEETAAHVIR